MSDQTTPAGEEVALRFTKKPVEIEAMEFTGSPRTATRIINWALASGGTIRYRSGPRERLSINTLEGTMTADVGDWIIRGIKGEFYPCKPDIFRDTYDPAPSPEDGPSEAALLLDDEEYGGLPWDQREEVMRAALNALIATRTAPLLARAKAAEAERDEARDGYASWRKAGTEAMDSLLSIWRGLGDNRKHVTYGLDPERVVSEVFTYLNSFATERDEALAKMGRVEALADAWDAEDNGDMACGCGGCGYCTRVELWTPALRRALAGES